jgi:hypothetical protein
MAFLKETLHVLCHPHPAPGSKDIQEPRLLSVTATEVLTCYLLIGKSPSPEQPGTRLGIAHHLWEKCFFLLEGNMPWVTADQPVTSVVPQPCPDRAAHLSR